MLHLINDNGPAVQAAATVILVLLTGWYVLLTQRLAVHSRKDVELATEALEHAKRAAQEQRQAEAYRYLGDLWYETLQSCADRPRFLKTKVTQAYQDSMAPDERASYDVYCYKVWAYIEDIVVKGFHTDPQFHPVIEWAVAYHLSWLECNPLFFGLDQFWDTIESLKHRPQLTLGYSDLPTRNGDIDWDVVSPDYHAYILSPFAPEMVTAKDGQPVRNLLLRDLWAEPAEVLQSAAIADFGCGPGNLLPHLTHRATRVVGIDKSPGALDTAAKVAAGCDIEFVRREGDFRELPDSDQFDLIVAVNSVLPSTRAEVVPILKVIRSHLRPDGRLMAILPSYDTTEYLRDLWRQYYTETLGNARQAERIVQGFARMKRADDQEQLYAEDGRTRQAYHSPSSIQREFALSGLQLLTKPRKVYYPWDLVRRFDYGYFPDAPEEIWDWYVTAKAVAESQEVADSRSVDA